MCPYPAVNDTHPGPKRRREKGKTVKPMKILVKTETRRAAHVSRLALVLVAGGLLATASSTAAKAQMINPFGFYNGPALSQEDYAQGRIAAGKLLNEKPAEVGRYEDWSNPASGNHGKLTILSLFTTQNMPCRKVKADIIYGKAGTGPRSFTLDACQLPNGQWKTLS